MYLVGMDSCFCIRCSEILHKNTLMASFPYPRQQEDVFYQAFPPSQSSNQNYQLNLKFAPHVRDRYSPQQQVLLS